MIKNLMNIASEKINHYVSISISIDMNYFVARCQFFFLEKDNLGLLCITNIILGIISGLGLMFLCNNRNKAENYERFVKMKRIKIHLSRIIQ